jgi:hypothetical protein
MMNDLPAELVIRQFVGTGLQMKTAVINKYKQVPALAADRAVAGQKIFDFSIDLESDRAAMTTTGVFHANSF